MGRSLTMPGSALTARPRMSSMAGLVRMIDRCPTCEAPLTEGLCLTCDVAEEPSPEVEVESDDPMIGRLIADRYEIRSLHSTGGTARIYRGVQRSLDRDVIIKVIRPELLAQDDLTAEEAVSRFMVEARAASRLNHPNVVSVHDFGQTSAADGGQLFMVMEYLAGADLRTVHHRDPDLPFARVAELLKQTLSALGEAHHLGMAHRDVKPENIIIETTRAGNDLVKVIDFGLAKLNALQSVTRAGQTLGTPHYMAPEQIAGAALGSGDLYAVGVILFELLTGQVPFDGSNPVEILRKHIRAPRPDPREVAPHRDIPPALASVCVRAMHIDPAQRWADAESLSAAIVGAVGAGLSSGSMPDVGPARSSIPPTVPRPSAPSPPLPPRPEGAAEAARLAAELGLGELRASPAPDFETFLLVEECAAARAAVGDDEGVVAILEAAMEGGRALLRQGDLENGSSACTVFGTKLGAALRGLERFDEALAVLEESLDLTGPADRPRALVLEELARVAGSLGHLRDAAAWRGQALAIARKIGDRELVLRLVAAARE